MNALLHEGGDGLNSAQRTKRMIEEYHAKKPFTAIISIGVIVVSLLVIMAVCYACAFGVLYIVNLIINSHVG